MGMLVSVITVRILFCVYVVIGHSRCDARYYGVRHETHTYSTRERIVYTTF